MFDAPPPLAFLPGERKDTDKAIDFTPR